MAGCSLMLPGTGPFVTALTLQWWRTALNDTDPPQQHPAGRGAAAQGVLCQPGPGHPPPRLRAALQCCLKLSRLFLHSSKPQHHQSTGKDKKLHVAPAPWDARCSVGVRHTQHLSSNKCIGPRYWGLAQGLTGTLSLRSSLLARSDLQ